MAKKYTAASLEKFTLAELQKICRYYDIEYAASWRKPRLIKEILAYSPPALIKQTYEWRPPIPPEPIPVETKKSVRIQRIEDRKEQ